MTKLLPPDTSLKALAKLAGPIWIANIAIVGSGTIDTIMAGHLGKEHLAAIALGIATTISVLMGLVGVLMGLSPIAGHHFGARKFRAIGEELNQSFWLSLVLMAVGVPLLLNTDFWIELGGAKGEVAEMAAEFIRWTAFALPASLLGRCFIALNAAVSRPRITMWVSLGMLALKAPLNAVFMYGWLGFPAMGGGGAWISFFVLSWLSLFAFLAIWKFDKFYRPMHVEKFVGPRWELLKNHLHVGVPMGLSTFFEVSSFTLMAIFISRLGEETVSAHQIVANLTSMLYMVPLSLGIASSVLISQSLGARWPAVAEFILRRTLKISIVIAAVLATLLYIFKGNVIALYTSDAGVAATAAALVAFGCTYHVFDAMQAVSSFALRGYRVTRAPALAIDHPELGVIREGACADLAVLRLREGRFGYIDCGGGRLSGEGKLECVAAVRAGEVLYDPEARSAPDWQDAPAPYWTPPGQLRSWELRTEKSNGMKSSR